MEGEIRALAKVTATVSACMAYTRIASSRVTPGWRRLAALLPPMAILPFLPFFFSSIHLRTISAFFLSWLAIFKLLLLSFGQGPLHPSLPFSYFLSSASLPVSFPTTTTTKKPSTTSSILPTAIKAGLFLIILSLYPYRLHFHYYLLFALYSFHTYLALELVLGFAAFVATALIGLAIDPQFDAPYLSNSLQDFWGRRWNLMVTGILRPTVYLPVHRLSGPFAAVFATFLVSGLMHELMFYYITLSKPTGELTAFFVLHGLCTAAERWVQRSGGKKRRALPAVVATPAAVGFVAATGFWLFFPPLVRYGADEKILEECAAMMGFLEEAAKAILGQFRSVVNRTR